MPNRVSLILILFSYMKYDKSIHYSSVNQPEIPWVMSDTEMAHMVAHTRLSRIRQDICFLNSGASILPPRLRHTNQSVEAVTAPTQKKSRFSPLNWLLTPPRRTIVSR